MGHPGASAARPLPSNWKSHAAENIPLQFLGARRLSGGLWIHVRLETESCGESLEAWSLRKAGCLHTVRRARRPPGFIPEAVSRIFYMGLIRRATVLVPARAADRYRSTTAPCAGTPGLRFEPFAAAAIKGLLINRYQALFLPRVILASRIAGTVIAAIENLRPGVGAPHRPHGDGGSPDTDRPRHASASGVARDPTCERAAQGAAGNLLAARRSRRLRPNVIRADGKPHGLFTRMTAHRITP